MYCNMCVVAWQLMFTINIVSNEKLLFTDPQFRSMFITVLNRRFCFVLTKANTLKLKLHYSLYFLRYYE